jgi:hypothetical protein
VIIRFKEQRHIRDQFAYRNRLDERLSHQTALIRNQRQRSFRRHHKEFVIDLLPDRAVDAVRVAWPRWEWVNEQQVNPVFEQFASLLHECLERTPAALVSGRDNLDHRHDSITADMPNNNRSLLSPMKLDGRLCVVGSLRFGSRDGCRTASSIIPSGVLKRENVRPKPCGLLFRHGIQIGGEQPAIQRSADLRNPLMMKVVVNLRVHPFPVVHRHRFGLLHAFYA